MSEEVMLTTKDNPFNPHTQFDEWYVYDVQKGYNTCAYLGRVTITSDELSEQDQELDIDIAISEIISLNLTGNYILVTEEGFEEEMQSSKSK